ncbi:hypothetical protein ZWY2020_011134 [Hordeum vulgare]|nr:hypothetical protein ZWY2020_011134 [Hordeum vulgare]
MRSVGRQRGGWTSCLESRRRRASLQSAWYQQALQRYHSRNIRSRTLEVGDLVLRRVQSREGLHKLSPMWEVPFKVAHVSRPSVVRLDRQDGVPIQNAWNIQHIRKFYRNASALPLHRPSILPEPTSSRDTLM